MKRILVSGLLTASVALTPLPALADNAFVGGLVGGFIGSAIANQPKTQRVYRAPASSSVMAASHSSRRIASLF